MDNLTFFGVFAAGFVSFLSPCIIPLVPMYVGFLAGDAMENGKTNRKRLFVNAIGFLVGLMLIFSLLGATATALGMFLFKNRLLLMKAAGVFIVFFGIFQLGIFQPKFLKKESRFRFSGKSGRLGSSILLGMAFSFGWTPCVGPVLGSIIALASSSDSVSTGILMLVIYSIGFSIPFLLSVFLVEPVMKVVEKSDKAFKTIKIVTGLLMIVLGTLVYTDKLTSIIGFFS